MMDYVYADAFGVVILELLTGCSPVAACLLYMDEDELFVHMERFVDGRAGDWPPAVVSELACVAEECLDFRVRKRATVRDVLPRLEECVNAHV
jgi:hypothetical protein